jgi:hypothetical protein
MVKDPFGNQVVIQEKILKLTDQMKSSNEILDNLATVIEKPAMMFKMEGSKTQLYYLRAVGWNKMILVSVQKKLDHFEITNCEFDPSAKRLVELYNWADQLI